MLGTVLEDTVNVVRQITHEDVRHAFIVQAAAGVRNPLRFAYTIGTRRRYGTPGATIPEVPA